jgi:hypothetical protein
LQARACPSVTSVIVPLSGPDLQKFVQSLEVLDIIPSARKTTRNFAGQIGTISILEILFVLGTLTACPRTKPKNRFPGPLASIASPGGQVKSGCNRPRQRLIRPGDFPERFSQCLDNSSPAIFDHSTSQAILRSNARELASLRCKPEFLPILNWRDP